MTESASRQQQEILKLHATIDGSKIPFHSRIGTKLIVGFLIIACITGLVGYFSLNYSQTVGDKFHLLVLHTLPASDSLKEIKTAALNIETATNEYVFAPAENKNKFLDEIIEQKKKFNDNMKIYEDLLGRYFPDQIDLNESIRNTWNAFTQNSSNLVELRQSTPLASLPAALTQQALALDEEFQNSEDELFSSIDTAIANEVDEVGNRTAAVDTAIENSSWVALSSIVLSVIVALVFGLFFSQYISRPISNLKQASIQIGIGDYVTACKFLSKTHRHDEIGKLSLEIEKMRQSIESMKNNLDALVNQRTKELEVKNQELFEREKDLEKINLDLVNTELAKEEFISMVSHELKTPLTPLKMYAEMLLKTNRIGTLNEKQMKAMKMIHKSTSKLEMLINDIFDVYKLDIGKLRLNKKSVEITRLVEDNLAELEPLTQDKLIEFKAEIIPPTDNFNVLCDQKRIDQVISNLIKNSVDFVPDKDGKITIRAESDETSKNVTFTVEDNGVGIPLEKMDNLFKTFYQVDTGLSRKHGGTGLGLVICKGIIESHDGKIWIDKNYTHGTSIKFTLPIASSDNL